MVYSTHPYFPLHLPQITLKVNTPSHLALFEALLSAIFFGEEDRGRRGERRSCLSAARGREDTSIRSEWRRATKTLPSEVSHFLTLAWQRDQGQTLATWLPKHVNADPAVALGFSREIELHRLPETRSADRRQLSHDTAHSIARRLRAALSIGRRAAKLH